jgi:biotin operon repressor
MQEHLPLDSYLEDYLEGKAGKKELEGFIFAFILKNVQTFNLTDWDEEECSDFLCWLYPRLGRAIDKYQYEGASFTAYIVALIKLTSKEFRLLEKEHRLIERTYWDTAAEDMSVHTAEPEYLSDTARPFRPVANPRQALILLLKSYSFVSEEFIARAAPAIGMSREALIKMVDKLRSIRFEQDLAIRNMKERIYGQYFRCKTFERRRNATQEGSARYCVMQKRLERAEQRLENMKKALKAAKTGASNRQVARILGVSKGTIDSNIFAVKYRAGENTEDTQK